MVDLKIDLFKSELHCHLQMAGFNSFLTLGLLLLHFKLLKRQRGGIHCKQADGIAAAAAVSNVSVMTIRRLQNTFNTKQIRQCLVQAVG